MKYLPYAMSAALFTPVMAMAAATDLSWFDDLVSDLGGIVNALIPVLLALALLLFIWGVIQYFILGAEDEGKREAGRAYMLYAIIGLVAIVAVWGIVGLVMSMLGVSAATAPSAPGVPS